MPVNHCCLKVSSSETPVPIITSNVPSQCYCGHQTKGSVESQIELKIDFNGRLSCVFGYLNGKSSIKYLWNFFFGSRTAQFKLNSPHKKEQVITSTSQPLWRFPGSVQADPNTWERPQTFQTSLSGKLSFLLAVMILVFSVTFLALAKKPAKCCLPTSSFSFVSTLYFFLNIQHVSAIKRKIIITSVA